MLVPLVVFWGTVVLATYFAVVWDREEAKMRSETKKKSANMMSVMIQSVWLLNRIKQSGINQVAPLIGLSEVESSENFDIRRAQKRKERSDFHVRRKECRIGCEHSLMEDSLPMVFKTTEFTSKILHEIKRHHKWMSMCFHYSVTFPRAMRVLVVTTHIVTTIFFIAIAYSAANPEETGDCKMYLTERECLTPKSAFRTGQSECKWVERDDECRFINSNMLVRVILFVVVFAALLAAPVNMISSYIIKHILAAPVLLAASKYSPERAVNVEEEDGTLEPQLREKPLHPAASLDTIPIATNTVLVKSPQQCGAKELLQLETELRRYREFHVKGIVERRKLDRMWGLASSGLFVKAEQADSYAHWLRLRLVQPDRAHVQKQVLLGILRAQKLEKLEVEYIKQAFPSEVEVGKTLLFYLHCDLLPGLSGRVLENKGWRDRERAVPVGWQLKLLCWIVILALNVGCMYYVIAFAVEQSSPRRSAWFKSFMLYLVLDFVGLSSVHVAVTHYALPSVAMRKVAAVKEFLVRRYQSIEIEVQKRRNAKALAQNAVRPFQTGTDMESGEITVISARKPAHWFNAADFLYVSQRLSKHVSTVVEAHIVQLCAETQSTRQAVLKEVMAHVPSSKPKPPRAQPRYAGAFLQSALAACVGAAAWWIYFVKLSLRFLFGFMRPFLVVAVTFPESLQDLALELCAVVLLGYILLLHIMLYEFYPLVAFLPVFVIGTVAHFYFTSSNAATHTKLTRLKAETLRVKAEQRRLHELRLQREEQHMEEEIISCATATAEALAPATTPSSTMSGVHETITRNSARRRSSSQALDPSRRGSTGSVDHSVESAKFESRLHTFLASADKVLHAQEESPKHYLHSPTGSSSGFGKDGHGSSTTSMTSSSLHGRSQPTLLAVESFHQHRIQHQLEQEEKPQSSAQSPVKLETSDTATSAVGDVAGGDAHNSTPARQKRLLVKKASIGTGQERIEDK